MHIPLLVNESLTCDILQKSEMSDLLVWVRLINWDKALMVNNFFFLSLRYNYARCVEIFKSLTPSLVVEKMGKKEKGEEKIGKKTWISSICLQRENGGERK